MGMNLKDEGRMTIVPPSATELMAAMLRLSSSASANEKEASLRHSFGDTGDFGTPLAGRDTAPVMATRQIQAGHSEGRT